MVATTIRAVHRLSVEDVLTVARAGIIDEHARVELEQGVLIVMKAIGPEHLRTSVGR